MKFDFAKLKEYRQSLALNQLSFWSRIGVTQSGGSRYESGRSVPTPAAILLWLVENGKVTEADLTAASKAVAKAGNVEKAAPAKKK